MQDKPPFLTNRTARQHDLLPLFVIDFRTFFGLFQQFAQGHVGRVVNNQAHGAFVIVLAYIG